MKIKSGFRFIVIASAAVLLQLLALELYSLYSVRQEVTVRTRYTDEGELEDFIYPVSSLQPMEKDIACNGLWERYDYYNLHATYGPFVSFYYDLFMANAYKSRNASCRVERELREMLKDSAADENSRRWISYFHEKRAEADN